MWHASVSMNDHRRVLPIAELAKRDVRTLEELAWSLAGIVGRSDLNRWDQSENGTVLHLRRGLTDLELRAVQAVTPEFLACPAVDVAGITNAYKPITGLGH